MSTLGQPLPATSSASAAAAPRPRPRPGAEALAQARLAVVPSRRPAPPRVPFVVLVVTVLVGGVVGLLALNTSMQQGSFTAATLEARAAAAAAEQQALELELERLRDPQRVAERAQGLGMVPASSPAFLDLRSGAVLGDPRPATAEDGFRITPRPVVKPASLAPAPVVVRVPAPEPVTTRADGRAAPRRADDAAAPARGRNGQEPSQQRRRAARGGGR